MVTSTSPTTQYLTSVRENLPSISVGDINVAGNVTGNIVVGSRNVIGDFNVVCEVNNSHGVVINLASPPEIKRRPAVPVPPRSPRGFLGRASELKAVGQFIEGRFAVSIHGFDGVGKTMLVKKAAQEETAGTLPDGVVYVEGVEEMNTLSLQDIFQRLFDRLYESTPPVKVTTSIAQGYLSDTRPLIILDHLGIPADSLERLPDMLPKAALLVVSQERLSEAGFEPFEVRPLQREESIRLFAERSGIVPDSSEVGQRINDICGLLNDVPLAISRVARAIAQKRLDFRSVVLNLNAFDPASQDPVEGAVERSFAIIFNALKSEEKEMLAHVLAAPGISVDRAWLESVAGGETTSRALEALEMLAANSPRLRLTGNKRQARAELAGNTDLGDLIPRRERLLRHLLNELQSRSLDFEFVGDELGNILGLMQWTAGQQRWSEVIALGRAVDPYLVLHGLWDVWETVLNLVRRAAQTMNDLAVEAWVLHQLGTREAGVGGLRRAVSLLFDALRMRVSLGDRIGAAYTLHNLLLLLPPKGNGGGGTNPPKPKPWDQLLRQETGALIGNPAVILGVILATIIAAVLAKPALSMSPQADPVTYNPIGQMIQYQYKVSNSGLRRVAGPITVTNERGLPIRCPAVETVGNEDAYLDWNESLECYAQYKITGADIENGAVTDTSQASAQGSDLESSPQSITVSYDPDSVNLSIKTDPEVFSNPGEAITFTYVIENLGDQGLPGPVQVDAGANTQVNCPEVTAEGQAVASNETMTCTSTYTTTESDVKQGFVTATARASIGNRRSADQNITIYAVPSAALGLVKSAEPTIYTDIDQQINYSYIVTNQTSEPLTDLNIVVFDDLVKEVFCPDFYKVGDLDGQFEPGEEMKCEVSYAITQADIDRGFVTNHADAHAGDFSSEKSSFTIYYKEAPPILSLTKSADRETYSVVNERVLYTYNVTNTGGSPIAGPISVYDDIMQPDCPRLTKINDRDNLLSPGETVTCTGIYEIHAEDIDRRTVTNIAWAQAGHSASEPATVTIHYKPIEFPPAFLKLTKYAEPTSYQRVEDVITYTYYVTNAGKGAASGRLVVQDDRTDQGVVCDGPSGVPETVDRLEPGETIKCSATHTITQQDMEDGSVTNTATAGMGNDISEPASATVYRQSIDLKIQADREVDGYQKLDDVIRYSYIVTPYSVTPVSGLVRIQDDKILNISCPNASPESPQVISFVAAQPGQPVICTASYTITQADIDPVEGDRGSVVNNAVSFMDRMESNPASMTVWGPFADPRLEITNTAREQFYDHVGQTMTYDYVVKNTGNVTLSPAIQVSDEQGTTVDCIAADRVLSPQGTVTCTGTYTTAQSDFNFGSSTVTHTVSAAGNFRQTPVVSGPASAIVRCDYPPNGWLPFTVAAGEDFGTIISWFTTSIEEMQKKNCMGSSQTVSAGQTLYAPEAPPNAVVSGIITDTSGSPVAGVTVVLSGNGIAPQSMITGGNGYYTFSVREPGTYTIFHKGVPLRRGETTIQNFEILPVPR